MRRGTGTEAVILKGSQRGGKENIRLKSKKSTVRIRRGFKFRWGKETRRRGGWGSVCGRSRDMGEREREVLGRSYYERYSWEGTEERMS